MEKEHKEHEEEEKNIAVAGGIPPLIKLVRHGKHVERR